MIGKAGQSAGVMISELISRASWFLREWKRKRQTEVMISFDRDLARQAGMEENKEIYEFSRVEQDVAFGRQDRKHLRYLKSLEPVVRIPGLSGAMPDVGDRRMVVIRSGDTYKHVTRFLRHSGIPWKEDPVGKPSGR